MYEFGKKTAKWCYCGFLYRSKLLRLLERRRKDFCVTILMYHKVDPVDDPLGLSIPPGLFEKQIQFLSENYKIIPLKEAVEKISTGGLALDCIAITFDDGYRDNFLHAHPILAKYRIPYTVFLTYDGIEKGVFDWHLFDQAILHSPKMELDLVDMQLGKYVISTPAQRKRTIIELHNRLKKMEERLRLDIMEEIIRIYGSTQRTNRIMLCWEEVTQMLESGIMTVGSHTLSHPILTRIPKEQAWVEISRSRQKIAEKVGRPIDLFAYPNGRISDYDEGLQGMVNEAGYKAAFTTIQGSNRAGTDLFALRRQDITINGITSPFGQFSPCLFSAKIFGIFDD